MNIPTYDQFLLPLLRLLADGKEYTFGELVELLTKEFEISEEDQKALLPSGTQTILKNRIGWAKTHLSKAQLLESPSRGVAKITLRGKEILSAKPSAINRKLLLRFSEYQEFAARRNNSSVTADNQSLETSTQTPTEIVEAAMQEIISDLSSDLLQRVKACSPEFFERLVVDILVRMGYGGNFADAAQAVGKTGDGGIDGIIKEDRLGLDRIYIQAKRWDKSVGSPEILAFIGALQKQHANKGVFITTSDYTKSARETAEGLNTKIVLIDGKQLANFMIDYDAGCSVVRSYHIKKVDPDYFVDED